MPITFTYRNIAVFFYCLLISAMVISPAFLSISMIILCVLAVFRFEIIKGKISLGLNTEGIKRMKNIFKYPSFAVLLLFFAITALWFYPIGELDYLLTRLQVKIPFIVLPFAFLGLPRFSKDDFKKVIYFMLVFFSIVSLGVLVNYFQNYEIITEQIKRGQHIPTPKNHIRYSLLVASTIMGGIFFLFGTFQQKYKWERWLVILLTVFLFVFIHLLSVKSGLLVLYASLSFGLLQFIWLEKQVLKGLLGLLCLFLLPFLAYKTIPSFKNKVQYFEYDIKMYKNKEGAQYSDSGRLASIHTGWEIAKKNWLLGVGSSNIRQEVSAYYKEHFPDYPTIFMMHNQFLYALAIAGVLGLFLTLFAFFYPLFYHQNYKHPLFLNFYFSIFVIIMLEHALENAVGVAHYVFFLLLFLSYLNRKTDPVYES